MNLHQRQNGIVATLNIILLLSLFAASGIGYAVYRANHRLAEETQNTTPPATTQNQETPTMGIDYPVPQGIQGKVFCNEKVDPMPCSTKIEFEIQPSNPAMGSRGPIKTVETDAQGNFSIDLAPGSYVITPAPKTNFPMFVPPLVNPVIVKDRQMTEITITYHSGLKSQ